MIRRPLPTIIRWIQHPSCRFQWLFVDLSVLGLILVSVAPCTYGIRPFRWIVYVTLLTMGRPATVYFCKYQTFVCSLCIHAKFYCYSKLHKGTEWGNHGGEGHQKHAVITGWYRRFLFVWDNQQFVSSAPKQKCEQVVNNCESNVAATNISPYEYKWFVGLVIAYGKEVALNDTLAS